MQERGKMVQDESSSSCGEMGLGTNIFGRGQRDVPGEHQEKARIEQKLCPWGETHIHYGVERHKENLHES